MLEIQPTGEVLGATVVGAEDARLHNAQGNADPGEGMSAGECVAHAHASANATDGHRQRGELGPTRLRNSHTGTAVMPPTRPLK